MAQGGASWAPCGSGCVRRGAGRAVYDLCRRGPGRTESAREDETFSAFAFARGVTAFDYSLHATTVDATQHESRQSSTAHTKLPRRRDFRFYLQSYSRKSKARSHPTYAVRGVCGDVCPTIMAGPGVAGRIAHATRHIHNVMSFTSIVRSAWLISLSPVSSKPRQLYEIRQQLLSITKGTQAAAM